MLNKAGKGKFDQRSIECIFVGYSTESKAYRLWDSVSQKIRRSRDVRFVKNSNVPVRHVNLMESENNEADSSEKDVPCIVIKPNIKKVNRQDEIVPAGDIEDDSPEEDNSEEEESRDLKRAPGRPRIIRTERRGRPKRLFQEVRVEPRQYIESEERPSEETTLVEPVANIAEISMKDALEGADQNDWRKAIETEVRCLIKNNTFNVVDNPENGKVIGCRTVLTNKYKVDRSLEKRKARIVAKGYAQRPGVDYMDTFAPVARMDSIRLLLALAVKLEMTVEQIDVTSAYLNGILDEEIYMDMPDKLEESLTRLAANQREDKKIRETAEKLLKEIGSCSNPVCYLNKALYGLKTSRKAVARKTQRKIEDSRSKTHCFRSLCI